MKISRLWAIMCFGSSICFGQGAWNPCTDLPKFRVGTDATAALDRIIHAVGFDPGTILLYASRDEKVAAKGGAMSVACNFGPGTERWIVYDPDLIKDDLARDFVFAHELAHHVNNQTLSAARWSKEDELQADYYGAVYLVRLKWTKEKLLSALDLLKLPQGSQNGYPSLEERRASVAKGFDDETGPATVTAPVSEAPAHATGELKLVARETAQKHITAGNTHYSAGEFDSAIADYREAIRLEPTLALAHHSLGITLGAKGDWDGDIAEQQEATRLTPDFADAHAELGSAFSHKENWDDSAKEAQEAIRLKPDLASAHALLGMAIGAKGDWNGALKEEQEAVRLSPGLYWAHWDLGFAMGKTGNWTADISEQQEAIRLMPAYAPAHYELGRAYEGNGNHQAALSEYLKASTLNPKNSTYKSDYDRLLKQLGSK